MIFFIVLKFESNVLVVVWIVENSKLFDALKCSLNTLKQCFIAVKRKLNVSWMFLLIWKRISMFHWWFYSCKEKIECFTDVFTVLKLKLNVSWMFYFLSKENQMFHGCFYCYKTQFQCSINTLVAVIIIMMSFPMQS